MSSVSVHVVAPAVGQAHHTGHDVTRHLDGDVDPSRLGADGGHLAVADAECGRITGVDLEHTPLLPLGESGDVVHPRVVRSQVAATDEQHAVAAPLPHERLQRRESVQDRFGGEFDTLVGRAQQLGEGGAERPEVDAVGCFPQRLQGEPPRRVAEVVSIRA